MEVVLPITFFLKCLFFIIHIIIGKYKTMNTYVNKCIKLALPIKGSKDATGHP